MISYNPKEWFTFIFRFHKSDTFRTLFPMIVAISIYAGVISWLELEYFDLSADSKVRNISILHQMLTFVISTLLAFRTNSAYDRWWEGRKLWGSLVNNSRNLAIKLNAMLPLDARVERSYFRVMIPNYAVMLKNHLKNAFLPNELKPHQHFEKMLLHQDQHNPNHIAAKMITYIYGLRAQNMINDTQILFISNELAALTDVCGACERIKNTPIPFSYNIFLKKFIFFFVMTLPVTLVFSLGYYCIPVTAFIFYVLTSMELIAEEIEDPFGGDDNDLPTDTIARNIRKAVEEILV